MRGKGHEWTIIGKEQEQGMNEDKEKQGPGNYKGHTRTSN